MYAYIYCLHQLLLRLMNELLYFLLILCVVLPSGLPGGPIVLEAFLETRIDMNPRSINMDNIEK
jgi:hypothetical protein